MRLEKAHSVILRESPMGRPKNLLFPSEILRPLRELRMTQVFNVLLL